MRKVGDFLAYGYLPKVRALQHDERVMATNDLRRVWGIGKTTAVRFFTTACSPRCAAAKKSNLIDEGVTSVAKLREAVRDGRFVPDKRQAAALENLEDLQERVPRAEVEQIRDFALEHARLVYGDDADVHGVVGGSYRRGSATSSDIDFLMCDRAHPSRVLPLHGLVQHLTSLGFLVNNGTYDVERPKSAKKTQIEFDAEGIEGYLGMCRLLGPGHRVRRLDIMSFRASTFACSTLVRLPFSAARVC